MTLRPITWLIYLPLAALPWLAAVSLQARFLTPDELYWRGFLFMPVRHWFWIAVALGIGVWVGWYTAVDAPKAEEAREP